MAKDKEQPNDKVHKSAPGDIDRRGGYPSGAVFFKNPPPPPPGPGPGPGSQTGPTPKKK